VEKQAKKQPLLDRLPNRKKESNRLGKIRTVLAKQYIVKLVTMIRKENPKLPI